MDTVTLGFIFIVLLLVLILVIRMPAGIAMAFTGAVGTFCIAGPDPTFNAISQIPYTAASNNVFSVIPMFVLMGWFAAESEISSDLFLIINRWIGWMRGGLAMAVSLMGGAFGAVCGDSITVSVTMTQICLPEMRKQKYKDVLSTGVLAASGNLGFLIPPSIAFIIYGIVTETSIGQLFVAGIFPGILLALMYCVFIYIWCLFDPKAGPAGKRASLRDCLRIPGGAWLMVILAVVVLGGIYQGFFTATEAGGAGAFVTFFFGVVTRRLNWVKIKRSLRNAILTTGMIFVLVIGANIFSRMLALSAVPFAIVDMVADLDVSLTLILAAILLIFVICGFFLDIMSVLLIMLPVISPILTHFGVDFIWFGVLVLVTVSMGQVTPPVGILVFAVGGVAQDISMVTIFKGALVFFIAMFVTLVILVAFPAISTYLPTAMAG